MPPMSPEPEDLLRHGARIRALALRLCADAHEVDDALQDTWLAALRTQAGSVRDARGWLATLLRNVVRQRRRGAVRQQQRERAVEPMASAEAADVAAQRAELHQQLCARVLALPEPQRALTLLHYFEGRDVVELAAERGLTPDAVRAHLRRARATLRSDLEREPGTWRTLLGLAPSTTLATATPVVAGTFAAMIMKHTGLWILGAAALLVGAWPWFGADSPATPVHPPDVSPAAVAAIDPAAVVEPRPDARVDVTPTDAAADSVALTLALHGLHPDAPWTAAIHLTLKGRDAVRDEWVRFEAAERPDGDGRWTVPMPAWAATSATRMRVRADDPNYLEFDLQEDGPLPASRRIDVDVQVVARLVGRVLDGTGQPVAAARIVAFALVEGEPQDVALAQTNSSAEGAFVLPVPPATPLFLVALPMVEASLSGMRMTTQHGAIADAGTCRADLLLATKTATGAIGREVAVGDFVLPAAAPITGTVRWSDGRPVAKASVGLIAPGAARRLAVDSVLAVHEVRTGVWAAIATSTTDDRGEFTLPAAVGGQWVVRLRAVPGHVLTGHHLAYRLAPPVRTEITLPLPVVVRAVDRGVAVPDAEFVLDGDRQRGGAAGELRVVVGDREAAVLARRAGLVSATQTLAASAAGSVVELDLQPAMAAVAIEFDGEFRVRNASFRFEPLPAGEAQVEMGLRDDRPGPFTFWLTPGRYRLKVGPGGGERNGWYLLWQEREFDLPSTGVELRLPALYGGRLVVDVVDANGVHLAGRCQVHDASGADLTAMFRAGEGNGVAMGKVGELFARGSNELMRMLPPGDYDLEFDLGSRGVHRQRATITARETTTVTVRVP